MAAALLYSVTVQLAQADAAGWLEWMRSEHIPEVLATGYFSRHRVLRLVSPETEPGTVTYSVQYECFSQQQLEAYVEQEAPRLRAAAAARYPNVHAFRAVLEVIT